MKIDSGFLIAIVIGIALCILIKHNFNIEGATNQPTPAAACIKKHFIDGNKCFEYKIPPDYSGWAGSKSGECPSKYNTKSSTEDVTGDCITGFPDCCKKTIKLLSQEEICNKLINESYGTPDQINDCLTKMPGCEFDHHKCIPARNKTQTARCNNALKDGGGDLMQIPHGFINDAFCKNYGSIRGLNCKVQFPGNYIDSSNNCADVNPPPPACESKKFSGSRADRKKNKNKICENYGNEIGKKCRYRKNPGDFARGGKCVSA